MSRTERPPRRTRPHATRRGLLLAFATFIVVTGAWLHLRAGLSWQVSAYEAVRLFTLETDLSITTPGRAPMAFLWFLRAAGPLVTALAGVELGEAAGLLHVPALRLRLFGRNHVVVVGLGRLGRLLCERLAQSGLVVAAIEIRADHPDIDALREQGIPVFIGDGTTAPMLRTVRIGHARALVAVTNHDLTNLDAGLTALPLTRKPEFRAMVQLYDRHLEGALHQFCPVALATDPRLTVLNSFDLAAHALCQDILPANGRESFVIAGFGRFGQAVLAALATLRDREDTRFVVIDPGLARREPVVLDAWSRLGERLSWEPHDMLSARALARVAAEGRGGRLVHFLICTDDDRKNLEFALAVRERCAEVQVAIRVFDAAHFKSLPRLRAVELTELVAPRSERNVLGWLERQARSMG
jgi:voltage-gated potassium channel Kch